MVDYCEVCKCDIKECLHNHHTALKGNRKIGDNGEEVTLCANCHEIIHHYLGGKSKQKAKVLTKRGTITIILNILKAKDLSIPYWVNHIKKIQKEMEVNRLSLSSGSSSSVRP